MIEEWINTDLNPRFDRLLQNEGVNIGSYADLKKDKKNVDLAIICHNQLHGQPIDQILQGLTSVENQPDISFFGYLRRDETHYLASSLSELERSDISMLIFDFHDSKLHDWLENANLNGHTLIFHSGHTLVDSLSNEAFDFSLCGIQNHLINAEAKNWLSKSPAYVINLGELIKDFSLCEPSVRQADHLIFDISCIKYADAPGQLKKGASGLSSECACQLMHYAGFNLNLKSLMFSGVDLLQMDEITYDLVKQLTWYFIHARATALQKQVQDSELIEFVIESDNDLYKSLTFVKNIQQDTWWLKIGTTKNRLLPCSEDDFNAVKSDVITKRIFHYIRHY